MSQMNPLTEYNVRNGSKMTETYLQLYKDKLSRIKLPWSVEESTVTLRTALSTEENC
jgi:hypothetical protein